MKILAVATFCLAATLSPALAGDARVSGPARILDGRTLVVAGRTIALAGIAAPGLGERCLYRGRPFDCGRLARAGLMDITVGGSVVCKHLGKPGWRCTGDGYDIAYGMIHAGWAVALADAPARYRAKTADARRRRVGLWRATLVDGRGVYAASLIR